MHTVTVMVREDCHACDDALDEVRRICAETGSSWVAEDVDTDPELRAEYGDRVPVFLVDGAEHGYWKVEPDRLRTALGG